MRLLLRGDGDILSYIYDVPPALKLFSDSYALQEGRISWSFALR
jgi:hypothetical protein